MKLIYLDTSHIALLSKEWENQSASIINFIAKWRSFDHVLALSTIHLAEISEHKSEETRSLRYSFLEKLLPIRFETGSFFEKEILSALIFKNLIQPVSSVEFFATHISDIDELIGLSQIMNTNFFLEMFNLIGNAQHFSWEAERHNQFERKSKTMRMKDISDTHPLSEDFGVTRSILEAYQNEIKDDVSPMFAEIMEKQFSNINSLIREFATASNEHGYRATLSEFFDLDIRNPKSLNKPIDKVLNEYKFSLLCNQTAISNNLPIDLFNGEYLNLGLS